MTRTISYGDSKYEFDLDDNGLMTQARRYGEDWPAGFEFRFTNCFMVALWVIRDMEDTMEDHRRLVRELDVLLNGEEGAAKQASLCDIVAQVRRSKATPC